MKNNKVKKEILEYLEKNRGAFFGRMAMGMDYPNRVIMEELIELKNEGLVYKDKDGGRYKRMDDD